MPSLADLLAGVRPLPGTDRFLHEHARALPQPDQLCGPFLGSLAIAAGNAVAYAGTDSVIDLAEAARSALWPHDLPGGRPPGERSHRVQPLPARRLDQAKSPFEAGTQAFHLGKAIEEMSPLRCIPATGTWTTESVVTLLNLKVPATVIANVDTAWLWGSQSVTALEHYLNTGDDSDGPIPEWQVGHFIVLYGTLAGERGTLVAVAETYPSLGNNGRLLQPASRVAAALARDRPGTGGVLVVVGRHSVSAAEQAIQRAGLQTDWWFN